MQDRITFKLSVELKTQLKQEAHEKGLTLSAYVKSIIAERKK